MGGCLCGRRKDGRILLLGLDGVGKTSIRNLIDTAAQNDLCGENVSRVLFLSRCPAILRKLKAGPKEEIDIPSQTVGFNLETITIKKHNYCVWVSKKHKLHVCSNVNERCYQYTTYMVTFSGHSCTLYICSLLAPNSKQ